MHIEETWLATVSLTFWIAFCTSVPCDDMSVKIVIMESQKFGLFSES